MEIETIDTLAQFPKDYPTGKLITVKSEKAYYFRNHAGELQKLSNVPAENLSAAPKAEAKKPKPKKVK